MGALIVYGIVGIPCVLFLLYLMTPWGREWYANE